MEIRVEKLSPDHLRFAGRCDGRFTVASRLVPTAQEGRITYTIIPAGPYEKRYPREAVDYAGYVDQPDRAVYLAFIEAQLAGEIRLGRWWNGFAYIEDLAVEPGLRRRGVGRALIEQAVAWTKAGGFPGIMLETQDINVPACMLYASCGFELSGFDRRLYEALAPETDETALYWYLLLPSTNGKRISE
jgi:ribosomal protein S18 acetylase RimI-like enzyme